MLPMQKRLLRAAILVRDLAEVGARRGRVKTNERKKSGERRKEEKEEGALFSVVRGLAFVLSSRFGCALLLLLFFDFFNFPLPRDSHYPPPPFFSAFLFLALYPRRAPTFSPFLFPPPLSASFD